MSEREALFLYHGLLIGEVAADAKRKARVTPLLNELATRFPDGVRRAIASEIEELFTAAEEKALRGRLH